MAIENSLPNSNVASHTLSFLSQMFEIDTLAFYTVNPESSTPTYKLFNVPQGFFHEYQDYGQHKDPFAVPKVQVSPLRLGLVSDHVTESRKTREYADFMGDHGFSDTIEIFLRANGELRGGVSILLEEDFRSWRKKQALYKKAEIAQPYLEFMLSKMLTQSPRERVKHWIATNKDLTKREACVTQLIAEGYCNKKISQKLSVSLATVKTHLVHVYAKTGVRNRSELIAKINQ